MDYTNRFFSDAAAQESPAEQMHFAFSSPASRSTSSNPSSSSIYEDRENIDPVTLRSALTGRRVLDREEPSVSGAGQPRLVDAEGNDLPQSRSPLPENYPRVPLQDITAVLEQQEYEKARAKVKAAAVAKSFALEGMMRGGASSKSSTSNQSKARQLSMSNSSRSTQLRSLR
ncbi:hypothetical protein KFL_001150040 [Klebsormidium nitens]|uniref:Uncharacterized protein n=1 Tax=Klebsormidium nitens TaxID=105231 RepID=A0A1Y1HV90_KLENI|nr:hypothetical protein KFL_001150040 [Klebsormidium nitens]|eukprot:GAQ82544.1 hypothetical protein KFL_001150040 [Klebsormidium nitens]